MAAINGVILGATKNDIRIVTTNKNNPGIKNSILLYTVF
jgi:hypothetical protein